MIGGNNVSIRFITAFPILPLDKMLDRKDLALINVLRENARMPVSAIAKKLGIGRATVKQRMDKLEKEHVVKRYTVELDAGKVGSGYAAFVLIAFMPGLASQREVARRVSAVKGVIELHVISGAWDMIARVHASSTEEIGSIVVDQLRSIDGVGRTETCSIFSTVKG